MDGMNLHKKYTSRLLERWIFYWHKFLTISLSSSPDVASMIGMWVKNNKIFQSFNATWKDDERLIIKD